MCMRLNVYLYFNEQLEIVSCKINILRRNFWYQKKKIKVIRYGISL